MRDEFLDARLDVGGRQVRPDEADAAVDVVADAAGRDDAALRRVGGRHAADRKPVAPVDVGHGQAGPLDAGERGHVGHLLGGVVVADLLDQRGVGVDDAVDPHAGLVGAGNPISIAADIFERPVKGLADGHEASCQGAAGRPAARLPLRVAANRHA